MSTAIAQLFVLILLVANAYKVVSAQASQTHHRELQRTILQKILDPKSYDSHLCPGGKNTSGALVTINVHVRSIFDLDDSKGEVSFQLTITQNWNDPRLSYTSRLKNEEMKYVVVRDLNKMWKPDTFVSNSKQENLHGFKKPNAFARIFPNGDVSMGERVSLTQACKLALKVYPFDTQICSIRLISDTYQTEDVRLAWRKDPIIVTSEVELKLNSFEFTTYETDHCHSQSTLGTFACLRADFTFKRDPKFYFMQVLIPFTLFVIIAYLVFWLEPQNLMARLGISLSTLYIATSHFFMLNSAMPKTRYFKHSDTFNAICLSFIFAALVETVVVYNVTTRTPGPIKSTKMDIVFIVVYPLAFIGITLNFTFMPWWYNS